MRAKKLIICEQEVLSTPPSGLAVGRRQLVYLELGRETTKTTTTKPPQKQLIRPNSRDCVRFNKLFPYGDDGCTYDCSGVRTYCDNAQSVENGHRQTVSRCSCSQVDDDSQVPNRSTRSSKPQTLAKTVYPQTVYTFTTIYIVK